jgi:hypothetical protein
MGEACLIIAILCFITGHWILGLIFLALWQMD